MLAEAASRLLLECVPSVGMLPAAIEAAQAMARAQGATLLVPEDAGLTPHISTMDRCLLAEAAELCAEAARSGRIRSDVVPAASDGLGDKLAVIALPLQADGRLVGVLYLEGLADSSPRITALLQRCAHALAGMLAHATPLRAPGRHLKASAGTIQGRQ